MSSGLPGLIERRFRAADTFVVWTFLLEFTIGGHSNVKSWQRWV